jgi:diguanylate cyclase (GGDEF)-like protein
MSEVSPSSAAPAPALVKASAATHSPSFDASLVGVEALVRSAPLALLVAFVSTTAIAWILQDRVSAAMGLFWCALAVSAIVLRLGPWLAKRAHKLTIQRSNARAVTVCVVAGSILIGFTVLLVPGLLWPKMTPTEQSVAVGIAVSVLTAGAISMASVPGAALTWVVFVGFLPCLLGLVFGSATMSVPLIALLIYCLLLIAGARHVSRIYQELVTARAEASRQAEMVSLLLHDFGEEARDWLWETGAMGKLTFASARMADALATQVNALMSRTLEDALCEVVHVETVESAQMAQRAELVQRFARQLPFRNQVIEYVSRGQRRWVSLSAKPLFHADGALLGWRGTGIDVTQEFLRQREMERLATSDSLTGLANRFVLAQTLDASFGNLGEVKPCALLLLDLDDFKLINDHFGHPTGDRVLQLVAERLQQHVRPGQLLARLGGDEFALVVPSEVPRARLAEIGERLLNSIAEPYVVDGMSMSVRCSIGIAIAGVDAHDSKSLLKCADLALYATKGAGRNGMRFFGFDMYRKVEDRFTLAEEMRRALENDEFELVYQPYVRTQTRELTGFEALVRWNHPERGMLYPDEFVAVAEETGLIARIGKWVLMTACAQARAWPVEARLSVNVSPAQFASTDVLKDVDEALQASKLPAHRLELEITESALFSDGHAARRTMQALRSRGVQISLDDFGAGHASLNHLRTFPLSRLKIDRSFTCAVADTTREGNEARSIVRAAIELARAMDLESTAEGVENTAQLDVLRGLYCDEVQGYEISYPMTLPALKSYFASLAQKSSPGEAPVARSRSA